jgi:hypothetical protein
MAITRRLDAGQVPAGRERRAADDGDTRHYDQNTQATRRRNPQSSRDGQPRIHSQLTTITPLSPLLQPSGELLDAQADATDDGNAVLPGWPTRFWTFHEMGLFPLWIREMSSLQFPGDAILR